MALPTQETLSFSSPPLPGPDGLTEILNKLKSLVAHRSGASRPSDIQQNEMWCNTTTATAQALNIYDGAQDITLGTFNSTTHTWTVAGALLLSLFTAENDFIIASGSGAAVKKTLAEIKVLIDSWAVAGGTADALTLASDVTSLTDGLRVTFRAANANATTTPTLNVNGLGAKTIVKAGGQALVAGDIPRALYECICVYNLANTRWELLNALPSSVIKANTTDTLQVGYTETAVAYTSGDIAVSAGSLRTCDTTSGVTLGAITGTGRVTLLLTGNGTVAYDAGYDYVIGAYDSAKAACAVQAINDGTSQWLIFANTEV